LLACSEPKWHHQVTKEAKPLAVQVKHYLMAQFLMHVAREPENSFCDVMCVAYDRSSLKFDFSDFLLLSKPHKHNVALQRVYYNEDLARSVFARAKHLAQMRTEALAKPWMVRRPDMAVIEARMAEKVRTALPHVFMAHGEFRSHALWRYALLDALNLARAKRTKNGAPSLERDWKRKVVHSAALMFFGEEQRALGMPYLHLPKSGASNKKQKK
jgi:hypothetical protein